MSKTIVFKADTTILILFEIIDPIVIGLIIIIFLMMPISAFSISLATFLILFNLLINLYVLFMTYGVAYVNSRSIRYLSGIIRKEEGLVLFKNITSIERYIGTLPGYAAFQNIQIHYFTNNKLHLYEMVITRGNISKDKFDELYDLIKKRAKFATVFPPRSPIPNSR